MEVVEVEWDDVPAVDQSHQPWAVDADLTEYPVEFFMAGAAGIDLEIFDNGGAKMLSDSTIPVFTADDEIGDEPGVQSCQVDARDGCDDGALFVEKGELMKIEWFEEEQALFLNRRSKLRGGMSVRALEVLVDESQRLLGFARALVIDLDDSQIVWG